MIIFYDWGDNETGQDGVCDHVGIVERVENGTVYTVRETPATAAAGGAIPLGTTRSTVTVSRPIKKQHVYRLSICRKTAFTWSKSQILLLFHMKTIFFSPARMQIHGFK